MRRTLKHCSFAVALASIAAIFLGCQSLNNYPPPVTPNMAKAGKTSGVTLAKLDQGRKLFASRCIECHVLPAVSQYPAEKWPRIVNWMGDRASLKPDQREAVIAYVLAAHAEKSVHGAEPKQQ